MIPQNHVYVYAIYMYMYSFQPITALLHLKAIFPSGSALTVIAILSRVPPA